ncbi:hypothetical protein OUZ56_006641 [Daphnia magna]|uniref:Uncharacterized protein n=1 Tax=Daphnia magna TaxID=35525 RepID=A0ABQ9YW82_9CRUS|nr:hypothetical protein OUZ56_006641 [Daphnia magna]
MMMPSFYLQLNTFGNKHFDRTDALRRRLSMKFLSTMNFCDCSSLSSTGPRCANSTK